MQNRRSRTEKKRFESGGFLSSAKAQSRRGFSKWTKRGAAIS
jgi:hypothetical protein